jgi:acetoin utilization deacetylase AcuC-like enzyme
VLQAAAGALPSSGPGAIGHLDGDTAISQGSFGGALAAAGSVCRAVDAVMGGQVQSKQLGVEMRACDTLQIRRATVHEGPAHGKLYLRVTIQAARS